MDSNEKLKFVVTYDFFLIEALLGQLERMFLPVQEYKSLTYLFILNLKTVWTWSRLKIKHNSEHSFHVLELSKCGNNE